VSAPRPPGEVVVGLDVGTTAVKAAAFGLDSPWERVAVREYPLLRPGRGRAVQDPATILAASGEALAECVAGAGGAKTLAISVSAGMHGLMALDADLHPLTQLVTWADARARGEARELRESGRAGELHAATGVPVHPMTPLAKLMWFKRHDPGTWAAARWWVGLKEYVLVWLTGRLVSELSSATGTGLIDMSTCAWSERAIALCGVDAAKLPPIVSSTATLGLAAAAAGRVGLPAGTPVVAGAGDGPLGNLGTGAMERGVAALSIGTSGAVRTVVHEPRVDRGGALFCYALADSLWVMGAAISNGGVVLRWAGDALAPDVKAAAGEEGADAAVLELAAGAPAGCDGLVMLPYLLAERAPLWDPDLPGAYLGLRSGHTRAHLVRAALEGVCMQMRILVDRLDEADRVRSVRVTGGVFRSALWREVMAAMLDRPIHLAGEAEGTALGAAALGLFALGRASTLTDAVTALSADGPAAETVEPDRRLVAAYDALRASVAGLAGELDTAARLFEHAR